MSFCFRNNALAYIRGKVGLSTKEHDRFLTTIFGPTGVTHSTSEVIYEVRTEKVDAIIQETAPASCPTLRAP